MRPIENMKAEGGDAIAADRDELAGIVGRVRAHKGGAMLAPHEAIRLLIARERYDHNGMANQLPKWDVLAAVTKAMLIAKGVL